MRVSLVLFGAMTILAAIGWYFFQEGLVAGGANRIAIDGDDIGGVVLGPDGPEAGVRVIAETNELPTKFVRSVVTNDNGRYVIPDLPEATYLVWSRGYGLLDSAKIEAAPGTQIHLAPEIAPDERSAAEIYPAMYWARYWTYPTRMNFPEPARTAMVSRQMFSVRNTGSII